MHLLSYAQLPPYGANDGVTDHEEGAPIAGNLITSKDASNVPSSREFRFCPRAIDVLISQILTLPHYSPV